MTTGVPVLNSNPPSQAQTRVPTTATEDPIVLSKQHESDAGVNSSSPNDAIPKRVDSVRSNENASRSQTAEQPNKISENENTNAVSPQIPESPAKDSTPGVVLVSPTATNTSNPPSIADEVSVAQKSSTPTSPKTSSPEAVPSSSSNSIPRGLSTNASIILVIGAPGAQKSDIAKRIAQKYDGFILCSMGALLRAKVAEESTDELWQRIARKIDLGEPVPMVGKINLAILIDCTEQFCLDTIAKRYDTGSKASPEDDPEVAKTRMALFKQNTLPMLKALDEKGILRVVRVPTVEGDSDPDTVFKDVSAVIDHSLLIQGKNHTYLCKVYFATHNDRFSWMFQEKNEPII
ncbi:hypothetical protein KIN20_023178 [Parelaphostrongylus tenuis]|uniref:Adenylate kinase n=1 Tax=Parelaphostrongylus tenuis TaxID=148309 RepID=A0AAD5N9W0_PARTN|nr:hypothetical protein KIN20_023178 [Parelaphostrongylus tenuis]